MSLTSYRTAPPREGRVDWDEGKRASGIRAWRRPTLPPLERQYHGRRGFSRPSSGWDRVFGPSLWPPGLPPRSLSPRKRGAGAREDVRREVSLGRGRAVWRCTRAVMRCAGAHREQADRAISTGQLRGLPRFHLRPIDVVVYHGSWRDLVLRRVSRLDAFSGYPVRT